MSTHTQQTIHIQSTNHARLAATVFTPANANGHALMVAPATGIRRHFYQPLAEYLANEGFAVISYDNDGIGDSLQGKAKHSSASLISWGRHDMPAVLNQLQQAFPDQQYHLVGHSAGGQLIGLMPNAHTLSSVFNIACSSGSLRNMAMPYRLKAQWFMNIFIPLSNALMGASHCEWIGMGQTLPPQVAAQWRQFCNGTGYETSEKPHLIL